MRIVLPGRLGFLIVAFAGLVVLGGLAGNLGAGRPVLAGTDSAAPLIIGRGERVVVFAPHPDDETLAAGGVIQEVLSRGGVVRIVFMTNGDGFRVAAERNLRKIRLDHGDFLSFGRRRQAEATQAARELGLEPQQVTFLGFPDRGLARLWTTDWGGDRAYRSGYTGASAVPYSRAWRPAAPYTGEALVAEIREILRREKPDRVFVPAAFDNHPDHWATGLFVAYALAESHAAGEAYAARTRLFTYVVHAPGWPSPLGLDTLRASGRPPFPKTGDGPWARFILSPNQLAAKRRAIGAHRSQVAVMSRFLYSFAVAEEYFQELRTRTLPRLTGAGPRTVPGKVDVGAMATLVEGAAAGEGPRSLASAAEAGHLFLQLRLSGPVSGNATLVFDLIGAGGEGGAGSRGDAVVPMKARGGRRTISVAVDVSARDADGQVRAAPHGARWSLSGETLTLAVPRQTIGGSGTVFIGVRVYRQGKEVGALPWVFGVLDGV